MYDTYMSTPGNTVKVTVSCVSVHPEDSQGVATEGLVPQHGEGNRRGADTGARGGRPENVGTQLSCLLHFDIESNADSY